MKEDYLALADDYAEAALMAWRRRLQFQMGQAWLDAFDRAQAWLVAHPQHDLTRPIETRPWRKRNA